MGPPPPTRSREYVEDSAAVTIIQQEATETRVSPSGRSFDVNPGDGIITTFEINCKDKPSGSQAQGDGQTDGPGKMTAYTVGSGTKVISSRSTMSESVSAPRARRRRRVTSCYHGDFSCHAKPFCQTVKLEMNILGSKDILKMLCSLDQDCEV
jgi:hypothetical protein